MSNFSVTFLGLLVASLGMLADGIIVFRFFGSDAMAAYGIVTPLMIAALAIGSVLTSGMQATIGKSMIRGDSDATNGYYSVAVLIGVITSAVLVAAVLIFRTPVIGLLRLSPESPLFEYAADYLTGCAVSYLFIIMISGFQPVIMLLGKRNVVYAATLYLEL